MLLSSTTDKITIDTSSIADTVILFDYAIGDKTASPMVMKAADTKVSFSNTIQSALDISGSPATNEVWQILGIQVLNIHASLANTVELKYVKSGGTARRLRKALLQFDESLCCDKNGVWFLYDSGSNVKSVSVPDIGRTYTQMAIAPSQPIVPPAGSVALWVQKWAGRPMVAWDGDNINDLTRVQPYLGGNQISLVKPGTGATAPVAIGLGTTDGGTLTHPALASTNFRTQNRHSLYANVVTTTNQFLGRRANEAAVWRGNAALMGGFFFHCRFAFGLVPAGTRLFVGLSSLLTGVQVTADPSAAAHDGIGLAMDLADTNLTIMTKDGTTNTKTAIGAGLAKAANVIYDLVMYCKANDTQIYVRLDQYNSATGVMTNLFDGPITATIPRNTIFLAPMAAMSNGTANTTVNTVQFALYSLYLESDF